MHPIQYSLADSSDVDGLFRVRTSVKENAMSAEELADIGITLESIAQMILEAPCAWVARDGDQVVGFSMVDLVEACLFAAFVLPAYEGQGIGSKLIQQAEEALFERHTSIWLETSKTSRAAGLYRHLGWWGNEADIGGGDIRLEKTLTA